MNLASLGIKLLVWNCFTQRYTGEVALKQKTCPGKKKKKKTSGKQVDFGGFVVYTVPTIWKMLQFIR